MKHFIALLCALALPALAQEAPAPPAEDWELLRAQAVDLRQRAKSMRTQADKTRVESEAFCRDKFLMAGCLEDARKARQEAEGALRRVELEALGIERRIKAHDREVRLERRAAKDREQEIDAARRAEDIRQRDEKRRQKVEKRQAEEEQRRQKPN